MRRGSAFYVRRHLHIVTNTSKILLALAAGLLISQPGCSHSLSSVQAAAFAAGLANDKCEHQYQKRPFRADQYQAVMHDGIYHWGSLTVGGLGGFSAIVSFRKDGGEPQVQIYYSTDILRPQDVRRPPGLAPDNSNRR